jgi:hypothetical protein
MSSSPGPSQDPDDIRRCREQHRDLFSTAQVRNPWVFVSGDSPLQCLAPPQIEDAIRRFNELAGAEDSVITDDWPSLLDSSVSKEENEQILLDHGAKLPLDERREAREITEDEVDRVELGRARDAILDVCDQLDVRGVDGAEVLELALEGQTDRVNQLLELTELSEREVEPLLADVDAEFGTEFVQDTIEECRDRLAGPRAVAETPPEELVEELRDRFGVTAPTTEEALAELEDRLRGAEQEGIEAAVNRLSRGFGVRFDSLDDAIETLRERIAQARGEWLQLAPIRARVLADEIRVAIDDGEAFEPFEELVQRRVRRVIDFSDVDPPQTVTVGEVAVRGWDEDAAIDEVDLERGIERFGRREGAEELEPIVPKREQEGLEELTEANRRADRAIELLER